LVQKVPYTVHAVARLVSDKRMVPLNKVVLEAVTLLTCVLVAIIAGWSLFSNNDKFKYYPI